MKLQLCSEVEDHQSSNSPIYVELVCCLAHDVL